MATITNLGFNIHSDWDGSGVRAARNDLAELRADMRLMSGAALHIDIAVDTDRATTEMARWRKENEENGLGLNVRLNIAQARADIQRLKQTIGDVNISFDINETSYKAAEARIAYLTRDRTVNINIDRDRLQEGLNDVTKGFNGVSSAAGNAGESGSRMGRMMKIAIAVVVASIAVLPGLITTVGATLMTLPGIATLALGGFFLSKIDAVVERFDKFKEAIYGVGAAAAEGMKEELFEAMDTIQAWAERNQEFFRMMYENAAKLIEPLTNSLTGFMDNMLPGVSAALARSVPFFEGFGQGFENLGGSIGRMFLVMSSEAEEFGRTWNIIFSFLGDIMEVFGRGATSMAENANNSMSESFQSVMGFFKGMLDGLNGFITATGQAEGGLGFFKSLGDFLREVLPSIGQFYAALSSALGPALNGFFIALGDLIGQIAVSAIPMLESFAIITLDVAKAFQALVDFLKPVMPVLGPIIAGASMFKIALMLLGPILTMVTLGVNGLTVAILANPIGAAVVAVVALVAAIVVLEAKFQVFSNAWEATWSKIGGPIKEFGSKIGEAFGPKMGEIWRAFKDAVQDAWDTIRPALIELKDQMAPLWEAAKPVLAVLGGAIVLLGTIIVDVFLHTIKPIISGIAGAIHAAIQIISGAIKIITGAMEIIKGIIEVVVNVVTLFWGVITGNDSNEKAGRIESLKKAWEGLLHGFQTVFRGIVGIIDALWDSIYNIFETAIGLVIGLVRGFFGGIMDFFEMLFTGITSTVDRIWTRVYDFFEAGIGPVVRFVGMLVSKVVDFFQWMWDILVGHSIVPDTINAIVEWFLSLPGKILSFVGDFISAIIDFFAKLPGNIWNALVDLHVFLIRKFIEAMEAVRQALPGLIDKVVTFFRELPGNIIEALGNLNDFLTFKFLQAIEKLKAALPGMIEKVLNFFKELPGKIVDHLKDIGQLGKWVVEGFWNGLVKMKDWLIDKVKNFFTDSIPGAIADVLNIGSPSKVTEEQGHWTGVGFANGLDGEQGTVKTAAQNLANQVTEIKAPAIPMDDVMMDFIKSTGTASEKVDILNNGLQVFRDKTFAAQDMELKLAETVSNTAEALQGFNSTMMDSTGKIDLTTEGGRKMYEQMKEVRESFDLAGASGAQMARDNGASLGQQAQAAYDASLSIRNSFILQMEQAGYTNEAAQNLANTYGMYPEDIRTRFMANLDQANEDVKKFMAEQRMIAFNYRYDQAENARFNAMTPEQRQNDAMQYAQSVGGYAEGGWISGPGSATSDSILAVDRSTGVPAAKVSAGEFVVNAEAANKNRTVLEAMNAGKSLPQLAEGGPIGIGMAESAASAITSTGTAALDKMLQTFSESTVKILAEIQGKWDDFLAKVKAGIDAFVPPFQAKWDEALTGNKTRLDAYSADALATWASLWQKTTDISNTSWTNLRAKWDETCAAFKMATETLRDNVQSTWTAFWDNIFTKSTDTWTAMGGKFDEFRSAIVGTVNAIKTQVEETWAGIVQIFKTPVTGVVQIWNDVSGAFGLQKIEGFAVGGAVSGKGNGTSDDVPANLSTGEHVWTAREVDAAGGQNAVYQMRQDVLRGGRQNVGIGNVGNDNRYAGGGEVRPATLDPTIAMAREKGDGRAYVYGGSGPEGFDCSGYMSAIFNSLTGRPLWNRAFSTESDFIGGGFAEGLGAGFSVGIMRGGGGPNSHMAGTLDGVNVESGGGHNSTRYGGPAAGADHNQFPIKYHLPIMEGGFVSGGFGGGMGGPSAEQIQKHKDAVAAIKAIMEETKAARASLAATSPAGDLPTFGTDRVGGGAIGKLDAALASASAAMGGTIPEGERRKIIEDAMAATNTPPPSTPEAWLAGMNTLITRESGWNAGARNDTDSNAAMGQNSVGLAQVIPGTFEANKAPGLNNIYGAVDNVAASINYIKRTYGSIENVQQANANMPPKGYATGTNNAAAGWQLVGEQGPEMVKFNGGEQVKSFNDIISAIKESSTADGKTLTTKLSADLDALGAKIVGQLQVSDKDLRAGLERILIQAGLEINVPISITGGDMQQIIADLQSQLLPKLEMMVRQGVGARQ